MRELIDEHHVGMAGYHCLEVHLGKDYPAVRNFSSRHDFQSNYSLLGERSAMRLDHTDDDVCASMLTSVRFVEHRHRLTNSRRRAEVDPEMTRGLDILTSLFRVGWRRPGGRRLWLIDRHQLFVDRRFVARSRISGRRFEAVERVPYRQAILFIQSQAFDTATSSHAKARHRRSAEEENVHLAAAVMERAAEHGAAPTACGLGSDNGARCDNTGPRTCVDHASSHRQALPERGVSELEAAHGRVLSASLSWSTLIYDDPRNPNSAG